MGTTLENGIYLPDEGERNCYDGLAGNWVALDNHLGSTDIHVTINDKQAWNGHVADTTIHVTSADKQAWNGHVADTTIHVTSADKQAWNGHIADSVKHVTAEDKQAWNEHVADTVKHVTASDKQTWNGKQDALSQTQLDAVNSGIDSSKVQQIATNTSDISSLQSGKANDSDVVHKSWDESVSGSKRFGVVQSFTGYPTIRLYSVADDINVLPSSTQQRDIRFTDKNNNIIAYFIFQHRNDANEPFRTCWRQVKFDGTAGYHSVNFNSLGEFYPENNNGIKLGTSTKRWKDCQTYLVNGVEPSSLSLPSGNANDIIDISSYITDMSGNVNNYTAPANGWISIAVVGTAIDIVSSSWSDSRLRASSGNVRMLYPVLKNETLAISVTGTTLAYARFIPCQGNA